MFLEIWNMQKTSDLKYKIKLDMLKIIFRKKNGASRKLNWLGDGHD
jgi:hypothetical protein